MGMRNWRIHRPIVFLFSFTLLLPSCSSSAELASSSSSSSAAVVTLDSIELFQTHEWIASSPTIFFQCKGEKEIMLPDIKAKSIRYTFQGQESWQPLTEIYDINCKRCGLYEKGLIKSSSVFDEWEFCASDFLRSDGRYLHFKDNEFNATFMCPNCVPLGKGPSYSLDLKMYLNRILIAVISVVGMVVVIVGLVAIWKYWQKRKRQQEQARFLKLFEESDEIEDELGFDPLNY